MEVVLDKYYEFQRFYDWALSVSDPRVKDWFLMQGYTPTIILTILYVFIVQAGKRLMENREPIRLHWVVVAYNFGCIALNLYICSTLFVYTYKAGYSFICQPVRYSYDDNEMHIASALWWFYFSKLVEMLDTIFFVLRKKNNQISFLHVYHHASMFPIWWIGIKWVAGGQSFFGAMVNSFIHVIMYTYYGVAALGPQFQKYLWWKKYLTMLQLTQFYIGMVYAFASLYLQCDFPLWMQYVALGYGVTIITLFLNFYFHEYITQRNKKRRLEIQFCVGMIHAAQSLVFTCDFPAWMHWALIFYAFTIFLLFMNFYFHAYIKSRRVKVQQQQNGKSANGKTEQNGEVKEQNGDMEVRKRR